MNYYSEKWTPKTLPSTRSREINVAEYFQAAYDLNKELVEDILDTGQVDVNSVNSFGQSEQEGKPREHMLHSFGCSMHGTATCQIFEKIDSALEVHSIHQMLKVSDNPESW